MKYILIIVRIIKILAPVILVCAVVVGAIIALVFLYKQLKSLQISNYINEQKKKKIHRKYNRQSRRGDWFFPAELFFRKCKENDITEFKSDYSIQKATAIIVELANAEGIVQKNLGKYLTPVKFEMYYQQGKDLADNKDHAEVIRKKQPRRGSPTRSEAIFLQRVVNLAKLSGSDKRKQMLTYLHGDYQDQINVKKECETSLSVFEAAMIRQPQEEHSLNTSADNTKIVQNTSYLLSGVPDLPYDIAQLEEWSEDVKYQLENINNKVVLSNPESAEILSNLRICKTEVKKSDSGVLHITLGITLKKPFELDIPPSIRMVVDGVLRGTVMFENVPVGEVLFSLPLYGIPSNTADIIELTGLCPFSVDSDRNVESWSRLTESDNPFIEDQFEKMLRDILEEESHNSPASHSAYTIKLTVNQNLWIMEA